MSSLVEKATLTSQQFSLEAVIGNDRLKVQVSFSESQSKRLKSSLTNSESEPKVAELSTAGVELKFI
jgi:hypothetical protein